MKPLAEIKDEDVFPGKKIESDGDWQDRRTVVVIVLDDLGKIALVTNPIHKQYILPGGGIEVDESILEAASRETQEEVGYSIKNSKIIGCTEEWRSRDKKHYQSFCIVAQTNKKIEGDFRTGEEKENNLTTRWVSPKKALSTFIKQKKELRKGNINFYNTAFNIVRDTLFVEEAFRVGCLK